MCGLAGKKTSNQSDELCLLSVMIIFNICCLAAMPTTLVIMHSFSKSVGNTYTKKKRVQTWSDTGHTQMLPCFCRSLDVITVEERERSRFQHKMSAYSIITIIIGCSTVVVLLLHKMHNSLRALTPLLSELMHIISFVYL